MSQEETLNFEKMAQNWQNAMIESWSSMTKQYVGSDGFAAASSAYMDWALAGQKQIRNNSAQFLDALEFPKRSDIARLSKQIAQAEARIAETEETMDTILATLRRVEQKLDAVDKAPAPPVVAAPVVQVEVAAPAPAKAPAAAKAQTSSNQTAAAVGRSKKKV